jgi:enoyl-[acyl-carrier protein] reductase I
MHLGLMDGKRVLITGARNKWSIAWHCALSVVAQGGQVAFSVYSEREAEDVRKLLEAENLPESPLLLCDATKADQVRALAAQVGERFDGRLDGLVHAMAYARREDLTGEFATTSQEGFALALDCSTYTLVALTQAMRPLLAAAAGSVVTLSYLGSERVVPGYNVMGVAKAALESSMRYLAHDLGPEGIRVNAVSAGPIKTLAASGIAGLREMIQHVAERAPLRRAVTAAEVGDACAFLLSDLARGITGETLYVDGGYNVMGM